MRACLRRGACAVCLFANKFECRRKLNVSIVRAHNMLAAQSLTARDSVMLYYDG